MIEPEAIIRELRASLVDLHPAHVFLFGSYALGTARTDSDVDVLVVLDTDSVPVNYEQRRARMLTVRQRLLPLNRRFSMDVLVLSKPEWRTLRQNQPEFADSIETEGLAVTGSSRPRRGWIGRPKTCRH
jgi:predicted nucleotidyltransferase